jgi:uncharacterized protein (TIGR03437 family)
MRIPHLFAAALLGSAALVSAQPVIADQGVTNAASYSILGVTNGGIAPGSIFLVFGTGLGPSTLQAALTYPLSTELARTRVNIGNTPAFIVYTSATQVAAIAPSSVPLGTQPVTVIHDDRTSAPVNVPVVSTDLGIFTRNSAGYGQAAAQTVFVPGGDVRTLGLATSVRPGDAVVLYATGLGAIAGAPDDRAPGVARTTTPVEVVIGSRTVAPAYAGRSPNYPGLDQINFIVPADVNAGCYVPVAVRANGRLSNVVSLPVSQASRLCPHSAGLSESAAARLDAGGTITLAQVLGERQASETGVVGEGLGLGIAEVDANSLEAAISPVIDPYVSGLPGVCVFRAFDENSTVVRRPRVSRPRFLDAGSAVRLTGPSYSADLPRSPDSTYGMNLPPNTLRPGRWAFITATGGGLDIGPFEIATNLPEPLTWTNRQETVDRTQPLRIEWSTTDAAPVNIVVTADMPSGSTVRAGSIHCAARAEDRSITIPAALTAMLPAGGSGGVILTQAVSRNGFTVPLTRGGNVEGSLFQVTYTSSGRIRVQ